MTQRRLLMKPNRSDELTVICEFSKVISADKLQFKVLIPPGVPAIRIFTADEKPPNSPNPGVKRSNTDRGKDRRSSVTVAHRRTASNPGVDVMQQMLLFFNQRDEWHA